MTACATVEVLAGNSLRPGSHGGGTQRSLLKHVDEARLTFQTSGRVCERIARWLAVSHPRAVHEVLQHNALITMRTTVRRRGADLCAHPTFADQAGRAVVETCGFVSRARSIDLYRPFRPAVGPPAVRIVGISNKRTLLARIASDLGNRVAGAIVAGAQEPPSLGDPTPHEHNIPRR